MKRTLKTSRDRVGYLFILPWVIGFIIFFVQPIVQLLQMSFSDFEIGTAGLNLLPLEDKWELYKSAFNADNFFPTYLVSSLSDLLTVPITVFFSLISGLILSKSFRGQTAMRAIFFLPLIISSTVVISIIRQAAADVIMSSSGEHSSLFNAEGLANMLLESGLPDKIVDFLSTLVTNVADLVWMSTVQTFIFLIALLAIPNSYYEVAQIEGATAWETFWKITFPISLPYVLVNIVYTIIDTFSSTSNKVIMYITNTANVNLQYNYAAAMSWIYFLIIVVIIVLVFLLFKPFLKSTAQ